MNKLNFLLSFGLLSLVTKKVNAQGLLTNKSGLASVTDEFAGETNLNNRDIGSIAADIIGVILSFLALIFVVLIIVSGFQWMTAGGNEEQVNKSKKRLVNSVIGLIIILSAYAITYFVFKNLPFSASQQMPQAT